MALRKQPTPKPWRSKEAKQIVAAVQRAGGQGGAHRQRPSEGHRADRFGHRRLSPQHRPHRWAGRPQHPGHDQEQDQTPGLNRSADGGANGSGRGAPGRDCSRGPGVRGRHRCLPSADDQRSEDGQHGYHTSDGLATWDTTRRPVRQCGERVDLQLGGRPWWCRSRTARASGRRADGVPRSAVHTTFPDHDVTRGRWFS
jgi:hypothetical protein